MLSIFSYLFRRFDANNFYSVIPKKSSGLWRVVAARNAVHETGFTGFAGKTKISRHQMSSSELHKNKSADKEDTDQQND